MRVKNISNGVVLVGDAYVFPGEVADAPAHVIKAALARHPHRLAILGDSDDNNRLTPENELPSEDILNPVGDDLTKIKGVGERTAELLREVGYTTIQAIADADAEELANINGGSVSKAQSWIEGANNLLDRAVS